MKIKDMPWYIQPWSRVANDGVSAMNDAELLAAVLGEGYGEDSFVSIKEKGVSIQGRCISDREYIQSNCN